MKTITILSQKGGTGKTSVAIQLAVAASTDKKTTLLVDTDPQASATSWGDIREGDTPIVESCHATRLSYVLETAGKHAVDLSIIDTAPHAQQENITAARLSDFILIPCRPSTTDILAIRDSIEIANFVKKPFAVLLNAAPAQGTLTQQAQEAISEYDASLVPVILGNRIVYTYSFTQGQAVQEFDPHSKAAQEVKALYSWLSATIQ